MAKKDKEHIEIEHKLNIGLKKWAKIKILYNFLWIKKKYIFEEVLGCKLNELRGILDIVINLETQTFETDILGYGSRCSLSI